MSVDDKTRAEAIAYADAMVEWIEDESGDVVQPDWRLHRDGFSLEGYDLARCKAERAIDELTDYGLEIDVRWPAVAAMLRLGWCPGDPVPAEIIARWAP